MICAAFVKCQCKCWSHNENQHMHAYTQVKWKWEKYQNSGRENGDRSVSKEVSSEEWLSVVVRERWKWSGNGEKKNFFKKDTHCKILVGSCGCKWDVAGRCSTAYRGLGKQVTLTSIHMLIILGGCSNFSALYALLKNFARPSERTTTHSVIHVGCLKRKKLIVDLSVQ